MKIGVIGCGVVGFNTLKAFFSKGLNVIGFDISETVQKRIESEIGSQCVVRSLREVAQCDVVFICLPTAPQSESGECDLSIFEQVIQDMADMENFEDYACQLFVQRSTCPPSTARKYAQLFKKTHYAVNPSFLEKHTQWSDSINPVRIAFAGNETAIQLLEQIYAPFETTPKFISENFETVEFLKYVENITDAVLISLWNEFFVISDNLNIPRTEFVKLIDAFVQRPRFGTAFRVPSKAFGLQCLPKDLTAMIYESKQSNNDMINVIQGAEKTNIAMHEKFGVNTLPTTELFNVIDGKIILSNIGRAILLENFNE